MQIFTARPQRIIGNVALASLLGGASVGLLIGLFWGVVQPGHSVLAWAKAIGGGLLFGPFFVFLAGIILVTPVLSALRYFGYGGPFFVYLISIVFSFLALSEDLRTGLLACVLSLPASYVFCRYAYQDSDDSAV